jgi:para-aminobenzoate synthetase component I
MNPIVEPAPFRDPVAVAALFAGVPGSALLGGGSGFGGRYSVLCGAPMLSLRSWGSRVETVAGGVRRVQFGDPWPHIEGWLDRFESPHVRDWPFPLGCCTGFLGYDLKNWVEPRLPRRRMDDLGVPDCDLGFHSAHLVWDHALRRAWVVACGLAPDGSRRRERASAEVSRWLDILNLPAALLPAAVAQPAPPSGGNTRRRRRAADDGVFTGAVRRALDWIRSGDIYQVNLARRLSAVWRTGGWDLYRRLLAASPAPFDAFFEGGDYALVSSSPELFLQWNGRHILTRPIKGTRPRSSDPDRDAALARELEASEKERAELLMITDLLRNDLGRICEYGSVRTPDLGRVESFAQVHHRVSTVEGVLRPEVSHVEAVRLSFPGGSVTGAPKVRAMEIIDELEPAARGPYCGAHGHFGFNQTGQLAITIRSAVVRRGRAWFYTGAGIVADSEPAAEFAETEAKAAGFMAAVSSAMVPGPVNPAATERPA